MKTLTTTAILGGDDEPLVIVAKVFLAVPQCGLYGRYLLGGLHDKHPKIGDKDRIKEIHTNAAYGAAEANLGKDVKAKPSHLPAAPTFTDNDKRYQLCWKNCESKVDVIFEEDQVRIELTAPSRYAHAICVSSGFEDWQ